MHRQEETQNKVQFFLKNSKEYHSLKAILQDFLQKNQTGDKLLDTIAACRSFKTLYLGIGQMNSGLIESCAKANGKTKEEYLEKIKEEATIPENTMGAKFLLNMVAFGDEVKSHYELEVAQEKETVKNFIAKSPIIAAMDKIVTQATGDVKVKTAKIVNEIKKAGAFDELLVLTTAPGSQSYAARTYAWTNSSLFGGISAMNYQLMLLSDAIKVAHNQFLQRADAPAATQQVSLQQ